MKSIQTRFLKPSLILLLLTGVLLSCLKPAYAVSPKFLMEKGSSGAMVTQLQQNLIHLDYLKINKPTGFYGSATENAVKLLQKDSGITAHGKVDAKTSSAITVLLDKEKKNASTCIVIDPGHGGTDPGTSKGNVVEKEVTLDISKKLQTLLLKDHYKVILTRSTDRALYSLSKISGTNQKRDLDARVNIIHNNNAKVFVSIHVNSVPTDSSLNGSVVYYNGKFSKTLATSIQKYLNAVKADGAGRTDNATESSNFYILKNTNVPGVLVETAFITNAKERKALSQQKFRSDLANAVYNGILNSGLLD